MQRDLFEHGALALSSADDIEGDYSSLAQVRDGNLLTLATRPSRPYPRA